MGQHFSARGYWVSTVEPDNAVIRDYIRQQEDQAGAEQIGIPNDREQAEEAPVRNANSASTTSPRKITANRQNAQKSTGPKSTDGKRRSSRNAIKHGLLSKDAVVAIGDGAEDAAEFDTLLQQLRDVYDPQDIQDELDLDELAVQYWRKRRALRAEMGSIRLSLDTIRADRSRRREDALDIDKMFLEMEGNKRNLLAVPEGIDYLVKIAAEIEADIKSKGYVPANHSGVDVLQHFGVRLAEMRKGQASETIAHLQDELTACRSAVMKSDSLHLDAQIAAGALPSPEVTTKILRYTTAIDRRLEQIRNRLEKRSTERRARQQPHGKADD